MRRKLAAGNWKMNGTGASLGALETIAGSHAGALSEIVICPPATLLHRAATVTSGTPVTLGDHAEHDGIVRAKARAAMAAGLKCIICAGEELHEREADNTLDIIGGQLAGSIPDDINADALVVAYEPIWAIGTGKVPSTEDIGIVHNFIRDRLERRFGSSMARGVRLLYGGSVKPSNAAEIFAVSNVDGALVGGASLKAADFSPIIQALDAS